MPLIINPGTGPVPGTLEQARENVAQLVREVPADATIGFRHIGANSDGRFKFMLNSGDRSCDVDMPGVPWADLQSGAANVFPPRLYVDGSSWMWGFAVQAVHRLLFENEED